jgi:hypothetical protein
MTTLRQPQFGNLYGRNCLADIANHPHAGLARGYHAIHLTQLKIVLGSSVVQRLSRYNVQS